MFLQRITEGDARGSLSDMHHLQQQLNRLLGSIPTGVQEFPAINVWTSEDGAVLRAELPGVNPDNVDISLINDTLTMKGERCSELEQDSGACHRQERGFGQFARTIKLPFAIEPDTVKADFKDGVLQVELPRAAAAKPRKIVVHCE